MLVPFMLRHSTKNENGSINREVWVKSCALIREAIALDESPEVQEQLKSIEGFKRPDLVDLFVKLDTELYKSLQLSSNLNLDYIERLNDEHKLLVLGEILKGFISRTSNSQEHLSTLSFIFLSHLYFKHDFLHEKIQRQVAKRQREDHNNFYIVTDSRKVIASLVDQVMKESSGEENVFTEQKIKVILY
jgi:hypothetical protein